MDGEVRTFRDNQLRPDDIGHVYHHFVAEGNEVPLSGLLLEFSDLGGARPFTLHPSARRPLIRHREYPRFFISYRRDDSEPYAWRLHERLSSSWGGADVFLDQLTIQAGDVFPWTVQQAAVHAKAMIVLVGPRWLNLPDSAGARRLDHEQDYVRREITAALDRGTLVVPLLLPGATVPERYSLPEEMQTLLDVQFYELSHRHWFDDVRRLQAQLEQYFKDVLHDPIS